MLRLKFNKMSNFHPFGVVGRGNETQLQVRENLNYLTKRLKGSNKTWRSQLASFQTDLGFVVNDGENWARCSTAMLS